jgi:hypothetical protein
MLDGLRPVADTVREMSGGDVMRNRTLWLVIGICLVVLIVVIPIAAPDHRIDVQRLAIWGGAVSTLCGALGAVIWIAKSDGRPFGSRDLELDRSSPYLRESRRWAVLGILVGAWFMLLLGTYWLVLEVYWSRVLVRDRRK